MGVGGDTPGLIPPMPPGYHVDGCTNWPDGDWVKCCDAHDWAWQNGADFFQSNVDLFLCVGRAGNWDLNHILNAVVMFFGVMTVGILWYSRAKNARR